MALSYTTYDEMKFSTWEWIQARSETLTTKEIEMLQDMNPEDS
jgi:hypothetical protein